MTIEPRLEALGYVAGGNFDNDPTGVKIEKLPDVKDMLPYLAKYEKAKLLGVKEVGTKKGSCC